MTELTLTLEKSINVIIAYNFLIDVRKAALITKTQNL